MRPIGVVRKVDQLGRLVLPKSLRKRFNMNEGDPVEILVQGEHIILERYRPHCVLCSSTDGVFEFRERYICKSCVENLTNLLDS